MPVVNHAFSRQINGWYCGPAATQVALSAKGVARTQDVLAGLLHTTTEGTGSSADVVRVLNGLLGAGTYEATFIGGMDATAEQVDELRRDVRYTIDAGYALVCNVAGPIVAQDGAPYRYDGGHYVAVVGYDVPDDTVLVADVNVREYWITTGQLATWIASRGYSSRVGAALPVPPPAPGPGASTIFGVDLSDFDAARGLTPAIVATFRAAGISFLTHKSVEVTQSGTVVHQRIGDQLTAGRDSGIPYLGAYIVARSGPSAEAQVAEHVRVLDQLVPWWRTFPGFFHQVDLEHWDYDAVPAAVGNAIAGVIRAQTHHPVVMYASRGQYGAESLSAPRWNANYPSRAQGDYRALYVAAGGNTGPGWAAYGSPTLVPEIWQYSSTATVAGQAGTDANAFRGTERDFGHMLGLTPDDEGDDDMAVKKGSICVGGSAGVLAWTDDVLGPVYRNIVDWKYKDMYAAEGWSLDPAGNAWEVDQLADLGELFSVAQARYYAALHAAAGGGASGPVTVSDDSVARIADAAADEIAKDPERDGTD